MYNSKQVEKDILPVEDKIATQEEYKISTDILIAVRNDTRNNVDSIPIL